MLNIRTKACFLGVLHACHSFGPEKHTAEVERPVERGDPDVRCKVTELSYMHHVTHNLETKKNIKVRHDGSCGLLGPQETKERSFSIDVLAESDRANEMRDGCSKRHRHSSWNVPVIWYTESCALLGKFTSGKQGVA